MDLAYRILVGVLGVNLLVCAVLLGFHVDENLAYLGLVIFYGVAGLAALHTAVFDDAV